MVLPESALGKHVSWKNLTHKQANARGVIVLVAVHLCTWCSPSLEGEWQLSEV